MSLNFTKIAEEYENRGKYDSLVDAIAKRIENGLENAPSVDSKALALVLPNFTLKCHTCKKVSTLKKYTEQMRILFSWLLAGKRGFFEYTDIWRKN